MGQVLRHTLPPDESIPARALQGVQNGVVSASAGTGAYAVFSPAYGTPPSVIPSAVGVGAQLLVAPKAGSAKIGPTSGGSVDVFWIAFQEG